MEQEPHIFKSDNLTRVILCAVCAAVLVYTAEALPPKKLPLWDTYRPWIEKNKLQTIAVLTVLLYGVSLALFPAKKPNENDEGDYTPCP